MINKKLKVGIGWIILSCIWWNYVFAGCDNTQPSDRIGDTLNVDVKNITVCNKSNWNCNSYNLKKDLGFPDLENFKLVKNWVFKNWTLYWPWSFYKSEQSTYPLYTTNGEKWWVCKPYYLTWHCWDGSDYASNAGTVSKFWKIASWRDDYWLLFWIPFSYVNWTIVNNLNIVTDTWHINGMLNESDIDFNFSFY